MRINFQLFADSMPFFIGFIQSYHTHIYIEATNLQLIEDDILHSMRFFQLTEIKTSIAQS